MNAETTLAALRAAERLGQTALEFLPYPNDVSEDMRDRVRSAEDEAVADLVFVRKLLDDAKRIVLDEAERRVRAE